MASLGAAAKGVLLVYDNHPIAYVKNITGPACSINEVDITNHDSPANYKQTVPGFLDGGEFTIEAVYTGDSDIGHAQLKTEYATRTTGSYRFIIPQLTDMFSFTAYVKGYEIGAPVDGALTFKATFKVSGATTLVSTPAANLTGLTISVGTLSPTFSATTYWYTATAGTGDSSSTVAATGSGTVYVNGTSGSQALTLTAGDWNTAIIEHKETNKASKVYRVSIFRESS